jgi:2-methylcitrate dehydratase PrpD
MTRFAAQDIAAFVTEFPTHAVPDAQIQLAKLRVLDTIGLILGAADTPAASAAITVAQTNAPASSHGASLVGQGARISPAWVAFAHGVIAHCRDFDDTFPDSVLHPGSTIVSTALALAEAHTTPSQDTLAAIALGYEIAARLGAVAGRRLHAKGFHATGIHGPIIAACTAARLLRLTPVQTISAIGLAASMSGGLLQFLQDATWSKWLHVGWSAHGGIIAAQLAANGFKGPAGALDGSYGLFAAFLGDDGPDIAPALTEALGTDWRAAQAAPKYFPCAHIIQPFISATLTLREEFGPTAITALTCRIAPWAVPIVCEPRATKCAPQDEMDVIASLPFQLAAAWIDGTVGLDALTPATRARPDLLQAAACVTTMADPTLQGFDGTIDATTQTGQQIQRRVPPLAIDQAALRRKFRQLAMRALPSAHVARLESTIDAFPPDAAVQIGSVLRQATT